MPPDFAFINLDACFRQLDFVTGFVWGKSTSWMIVPSDESIRRSDFSLLLDVDLNRFNLR